MTTEHHTQRIDFGENGYLEATRDDTEELQDLHLKAFLQDGTLVREIRILYNIQYDYDRRQHWKAGELITDYLDSIEGYGHLQWENSVGVKDPDWKNPYPDNYEPVKREGCDMFHLHGYEYPAYLYENKIIATMNCYIRKDLQAWKKPAEINIITDAHVATMWDEVEAIEEGFASESERLAKNPFNPEQARKKRINEIKRINQYLRCEFESDKYLKSIKANHEKDLDIEVPLDPRFID